MKNDRAGSRYVGITLDDAVRGLLQRDNRIAELEAALRDVRQVICEKAPDTLWIGLIETAVDRIDGVLGQK